MRKIFFPLLSLILIFLASSCATHLERSIVDLKSTVILISLDGFRADYMERFHPPTLEALAESGVRVSALKPVFPTLTFPNHYSIVTGLYPERHGIIGNSIKDPKIAEIFTLSKPEVTKDPRWWGGEPIWSTVVKGGQRSAAVFWPGSAVEINGLRPSYWEPYDASVPYATRVKKVLSWLDLPLEKRPTFIGLYFESPDSEGHEFGPSSEKTKDSVLEVDGMIAMLISELKKRNISDKVHLIIVSDHGMTDIVPQQQIILSQLLDLSQIEALGGGAFVGLYPKEGEEDATYQKLLHAHSHLKIFKRSQIPERYHYKMNSRVPPLLALADEGWYISKTNQQLPMGGHGYDNALKSMHGIFIGHGPRFKEKYIQKKLDNVEIYNLIATLLNVKAAPNDGKIENIKTFLK